MVVGLSLSPYVFKKTIHELKGASFLLFTAITLFMIVLVVQLCDVGTD